ncbi:MAG: exodeoxyribonuclease VII large subunit [Anaeromicrobium sp.]|jgi:exodeoxyribonuclease VII large subunit|uniref:exodeoxyribonuclease VII large subunit n=1 Tax=Anaeromicrobium sp. TaxID=1929132 RepID=UPI0025EE1E34|nr:exodeoxyribonuclease VII large subunit [Anaeromicrobium sp.]MCT4596177.1 exodeoxyribonuclease VII large subunit [Anaeromicrobium sp.]
MELKALSVTELNKYIKKLLTIDPILNNISLKGEISNFKLHSSGHAYFSIKDEESKINCIMFRNNVNILNFKPQNGIKVIVKGYVSVYERDGQYQLYAQSISLEGLGELHKKFKKLKDYLEKEGLFSPMHKKNIPNFPKKVGVITSPTGSAIRDIISVISRRNPLVNVYIFPSLVQGVNSSTSICDTIEKINSTYDNMDVIILSRGGGSIEELWSFNEESVARSIFFSKIPIISGIGHETDYTIADFVSDLRAPTPSAAAEICVKDLRDIKNFIKLKYEQSKISLEKNLVNMENTLSKLKPVNGKKIVENKLNTYENNINSIKQIMDFSVQNYLSKMEFKVENLGLKLGTLNPFATVNRGYAIVSTNCKTISSIDEVSIENKIKVNLKDGHLICTVENKHKESIVNGRFCSISSE